MRKKIAIAGSLAGIGIVAIVVVFVIFTMPTGGSGLLTASFPGTISHTLPMPVSGQLIVNNYPLPGAQIQLQSYSATCSGPSGYPYNPACYTASGVSGCSVSCWFDALNANTNSTGGYSFTYPANSFAVGYTFPLSYQFRTFFAGSSSYPLAISNVATVIFT